MFYVYLNGKKAPKLRPYWKDGESSFQWAIFTALNFIAFSNKELGTTYRNLPTDGYSSVTWDGSPFNLTDNDVIEIREK